MTPPLLPYFFIFLYNITLSYAVNLSFLSSHYLLKCIPIRLLPTPSTETAHIQVTHDLCVTLSQACQTRGRWSMWPTSCKFDILAPSNSQSQTSCYWYLTYSYTWFSSWNLISWTPYCLQCGLPLWLVLLISFLHLSNPQMLEDPGISPSVSSLGDLQQPLGFNTICGVSSQSYPSSSDLSLNYRFL